MDYEKILSEKVQKMKPSGIRKFFDIAAEIEGAISLSIGEPDFQTPWPIRRAAITALEKGKTKYTANAGIAELRQSVSRYLDKKIGVRYNPNSEIMITVGGSEAIDATIRAILNPGDEVIIPDPSFVCYAPLAEMADGKAVTVKTYFEDEFRLTPEALKAAITDKTKLLILPFPNNPTGAVMEREHLEAIAEVLRGTDIMVLSDEIYSELSYGTKHCSIASLDGMRERTIVVDGFSKAFSMTGWRLGFAAGPAPVIKQILKIHQYGIMSSPTVSQYAAIEALENCESEVKSMVAEYEMRRNLLVSSFNKMGLSCFEPKGAFYVFPCIKSTGLSSDEFCTRLLKEHKVAVVPGNAFGESGEGFVRVSYAYSVNHLNTALKRIEEFLESLKNEK